VREDPSMRMVAGKERGEGLKVALVVSRFNSVITEQLLSGALEALKRQGVSEEDTDVVRVPGAFELPAAARRVAALGRHDGVVALGAVIRGETAHFDYVAGEAARGIAELAIEGPCAVTFGVLTTENLQQAQERAGGKHGNKGADAALAVIELANLYRELAAWRGR
jgi:6,7-dimethyl-8-ribityllumazine synthase